MKKELISIFLAIVILSPIVFASYPMPAFPTQVDIYGLHAHSFSSLISSSILSSSVTISATNETPDFKSTKNNLRVGEIAVFTDLPLNNNICKAPVIMIGGTKTPLWDLDPPNQ